MKLLKKLSDWKVWLFTILPIILFATFFAIFVYAYAKKIYNAPLLIVGLITLTLGALISNLRNVFLAFTKKRYISGVIAVALLICFVSLQITLMVMTPKFIKLNQEEDIAYQIYKQTAYEDADYEKNWDSWFEAYDKSSDLSIKMSFITCAVLMIGSLLPCVTPHSKQSSKEEDAPST